MPHYFVTVTTLANTFNLTPRRIQQMVAEGTIPKADKGKYNLQECSHGYITSLQNREAESENEAHDAAVERARLLKAQADKTELEVQIMRGEMVPATEFEFALSSIVSAFRAHILALPIRLAHRIMNLKTYHEIEGCLRENFCEALDGMSRDDPKRHSSGDSYESDEVGGTAAEPEDQPMGGSVPAAE